MGKAEGSIITATIIIVAVVLYLHYQAVKAQQVDTSYEVTWEQEIKLIEMDQQALETAYRAHVGALFSSWMRDASGQPERAVRGMHKARKAFVGSMNAIERRQKK